MSDITFGIIMMGCGVLLATVYFTNQRKEPANEKPLEQCAKHIHDLRRRMEILESKTDKFKSNDEITNALKSVREEQANMRKLLNDSVENINTIVLRLIATFKPNKKEVSQ